MTQEELDALIAGGLDNDKITTDELEKETLEEVVTKDELEDEPILEQKTSADMA